MFSMKSVIPQPHSAWHIGQVLVMTSGPEYHVFAQSWQSSMFLQHLVTITSGLADTA